MPESCMKGTVEDFYKEMEKEEAISKRFMKKQMQQDAN